MTRVAVYRHYDASGALLYIGQSANPTRRLWEHKCRTDWAASVVRSEVDWFASRAEAVAAEARLIAELMPAGNVLFRGRKPAKAKTALGEWLAANQMTDTQFAALVGCSQPTICKLARDKARPSLRLAAAIQRATNGAVAVTSWPAAQVRA